MRVPTKMALAVVASTTLLVGVAATSGVAIAQEAPAGVSAAAAAQATGLTDVVLDGTTLTWRYPNASNAKKVRFAVQAKPATGGKTRTILAKGAFVEGDFVAWVLPWETTGPVKVRVDSAKKKGRKTVWVKGGWVQAGVVVPDEPEEWDGVCVNDHLTVGTLAPETGGMSGYGPQQFAAVDMAVSDINAGGGVLGVPVTHVKGDSGDWNTGTDLQTVRDHRAQGVGVVIGAGYSSENESLIDQVVASRMAMITFTNLNSNLHDYPDKGLYFRMAAPQALEGAAAAQHAIKNGLLRGVIVAQSGAYDQPSVEAFDAGFASRGGRVADRITYRSGALNASAIAKAVKAADPQVVYLAGYDDSRRIIDALIAEGVGPQDVQIYMPGSGFSNTAFRDLPEGTMNGVVVTFQISNPSVDPEDFAQRLWAFDPKVRSIYYGIQAYDATMLAAIAAQYAGCGDGPAIAKALPIISNGGDGTTICNTWDTCSTVITSGGIPKYVGQGDALDFDDQGDMTRGFFNLVEYVDNRFASNIDLIEISTRP